MDINEIISQRRQKAASLKARGVSLFPSKAPEHRPIGEVVNNFNEGAKEVICGRVMAKRLHGKVLFMDLRDATGKIQLYIKSDPAAKELFELAQDMDIADSLCVKGELFKTHTGEPTIKAEELLLLSKAYRPLPEKWHGLKDVETRYRQRYLDLASSQEVKDIFLKRSRIIGAIRSFLDQRGFLEVETPMMHFIPGGAAGRPFKTFHNEYDSQLYLRIAPELYLKRLLVGGLDKVYELNRNFRNEGVSTRHNPEFTMLELYSAYADYESMMQLCQELVIHAAKEVSGSLTFEYDGNTIDLTPPWKKVSFADLVKDKFGIEPQDDAAVMLRKLQSKGFAKDKDRLTRSQVNKVIEDSLEGDMGKNPLFVTDYFTSLCPLAKTKSDNRFISERFEVYIAGMEVGNAYSELNDPEEQRQRFADEIRDAEGPEKKNIDEDYLTALEHGMPPAGGLGIGIDRLVMLLTGNTAIRDVILFPLLRPQQQD